MSKPASDAPAATQPVVREKHVPDLQTQVATEWLLLRAQPHAPVRHMSGKSETPPQHKPSLTSPPVDVHSPASSEASPLTTRSSLAASLGLPPLPGAPPLPEAPPVEPPLPVDVQPLDGEKQLPVGHVQTGIQ